MDAGVRKGLPELCLPMILRLEGTDSDLGQSFVRAKEPSRTEKGLPP